MTITVERDPALYQPHATLRAALGLLSDETPADVRVSALHAVARARIELGDSRAAGEAMRSALRLAETARLARRLPELRLTMAWLHFDTGDLDACLCQLDLVQGDPRALCLRGLAWCATGDHARAEPILTEAASRLTDPRWSGNALCARGIVRSYAFRLADADADFAAAHRLYTSIGATERAATCLHNRGFVALRAADLPRALRLFDEAERAGMRAEERGEALVDRAGALLAGGLVTEASDVLDRAARLLGDKGRGTTFAEATLSLARCALLAGSPATAAWAAREATQLFRRQGRHGWTPVAEAIELRAQFAVGSAGALVSEASAVAARCRRSGWRVEAAELSLDAAHHATGADRRRLLADVATERTAGTAALRAVGWLARARSATDRRGVYAACRAGLRVVDEQIALVGSLELQAGVAALGGELAATGLRAAFASGQARQVLTWTDRHRSLTWRVQPVRPPDDPALAADLAQLRAAGDDVTAIARIERRIRSRALSAPPGRTEPTEPTDTALDGFVVGQNAAGAAGRAEPAGTPPGGVAGGDHMAGAAPVERRLGRRAVEAAGTALDGLAVGDGVAGAPRVRRRALGARSRVERVGATLDGLADRLGRRALVSFVEHDGTLWATTMVDGTVRLRRLGPLGDEVERLRFATAVTLRTRRGAAAARRSTDLVDQALLGPVRRLIGDRPLVLVPSGRLRTLPWAALPSCVGRPVSVVPSAAAWLRAGEVPAVDGSFVWVAGPGLRHADREVATLSARFGGRVLTGSSATVEATLGALDGAGGAHLAAHGTFRSDAAMFSSLALADGPLYGYDLDRLGRSPRLLVLSACDLARGEPIGLASVVFRRGTSVLIASTMPVPDDLVTGLVHTLHAGLRAGRAPARALADAQARHGHLGFVCVGAG